MSPKSGGIKYVHWDCWTKYTFGWRKKYYYFFRIRLYIHLLEQFTSKMHSFTYYVRTYTYLLSTILLICTSGPTSQKKWTWNILYQVRHFRIKHWNLTLNFWNLQNWAFLYKYWGTRPPCHQIGAPEHNEKIYMKAKGYFEKFREISCVTNTVSIFVFF